MEDVITETPPPSRFFPEDLDNFAPPSPPPTPPFLLFPAAQNPKPRPKLLIIAVSAASRDLLRRLSPKHLTASLFLPDLPLAGTGGCPVFAVPDGALVAAFSYPAPAETARAVAKALIHGIEPEEVLVFGAVRGLLSYRIETAARRAAGPVPALRGVPYYPTGSVVDGIAAAVLAECQMRGLKGTICLTSAEDGRISLESLFLRLLPGSELVVESKPVARVLTAESNLYV